MLDVLPECAFLATQKSTSGGSSESDVKAFAVIPRTVPSISAAITVTPVTKCPTVRRNSLGSMAICYAGDLFMIALTSALDTRSVAIQAVEVVLGHALLGEAHVTLARPSDVGDDERLERMLSWLPK